MVPWSHATTTFTYTWNGTKIELVHTDCNRNTRPTPAWMHQLEYRRIPPLPAQTPGIPEGPRRRYLSSVVLAVFVRVTIRFGEEGREGRGRGVGHPRTPNSYLSRSRIVCYACLHIWPGFSVSTSPVLLHPRPREHPILPFRCNRTRLRMSKLTSHPSPSVQRMRRTEMRVGEGWKFRLYLGETEKVVSRGTRMMIFCSSSSYWTDVLDDDRFWKILRKNIMILKNVPIYIFNLHRYKIPE